MTECSETLFPFEAHFSRQMVAQFEGSWPLEGLPTAGADRVPHGRDAGATDLQAGCGLGRPERSRAPAAGSASRCVGRKARSRRPPGREEDPEPVGITPAGSPAAERDPGRLQRSTCCFTTDTGSLPDAPQRPSELSQYDDLLLPFPPKDVGVRVRALSLAGFQVTNIGRFWVTAEVAN
jgi:hypothetical protein